ncbi:sigma-70 family RNA polymerase sigma factor [Nonomuraea sp. NPDC003804]|uniref:RNA polymerase sigma factor n=1 Tax=Nonomuraea sp. NPDC003804 TaxID=3154547 RepID=UPI0033A8528C
MTGHDGGAGAEGVPMREDLLKELAPQVLGVLVRRYGQFDACEDAVQEALLAAATQWPRDGLPDNPKAWLVTVASRRMIDEIRSEEARRRREAEVALETEPPEVPDTDDTLTLLFLCCHPALTPASQIALTLRAVGGLTTAEIAGAFLVPEATMAQRISRAKATIKKAGATFEMTPDRLDVVLHVLYLIFNEGYTATSGPDLQRADLTAEAVRLTRTVRRLLPDDGEVAGLLALMLLTDARRAARTDAEGALITLDEQDRTLWDKDLVAEGVDLVTAALSRGPLGPYQLQAAIAAVHTEEGETDWPQITALYELLARVAPGPMVTLNQAVAVAMARGPREGLALLDTVEGLEGHHRLYAVRGHLLEMAGQEEAARASFVRAAALTASLPERRYLEDKGRPRS